MVEAKDGAGQPQGGREPSYPDVPRHPIGLAGAFGTYPDQMDHSTTTPTVSNPTSPDFLDRFSGGGFFSAVRKWVDGKLEEDLGSPKTLDNTSPVIRRKSDDDYPIR